MLKGVAWVTLMTLLTLVSVDRVVCADGCTETESRSGITGDALTDGDAHGDCNTSCNPEPATAPAHPHSCVLCTMGLDEPAALPTLSALGIIGRLTVPASTRVTSIPPPLLDHPPRSVVS